ncbi:hypothetical protein MUU72_11055 [Streptomyces sp. RS10V-4]|uniref:hypothetical protein n=1 Tax=Streptomyces rhizoryzae TaxID=2932493 RepID=UPI002005D86B|nr:hypothetical protein [Streptomyces rhizoryzae]MCK7623627.1 hypothetical protein [Streptomyces rhizoryzae]
MAAFSRSGKPVGLDARYVGRLPCAVCGLRPMKLPGREGGVCIPCYAEERAAAGRRAASAGAWVAASFVGDPCLACGSRSVDANGWAFWCNSCQMQTAVALPPR